MEMSKQIDVGSLPVEQLAELKEQMTQEVEQLTQSLQTLANAANRLFMAGTAAEDLGKESSGERSKQ